MLKIGDFSKLANVTVKALRHYADLGLLTPALIDRFTGYRYYSLEQLSDLNRILALKDLGFSLEQIGDLLNQEVSVEQLRGMLRLKQAELQTRLLEEQRRLTRVETRLRQMEGAGFAYEIALKRVEALKIAALRECVQTREALPGAAARMQRRITRWLETAHLPVAGPWLALTHNHDYAEQAIDFELGVSLPTGVCLPASERGASGVQVRTLPACEQAAALVYCGPRDALAEAYAALFAWIELNQLRANGAARELYLQEPVDRDARLEFQPALSSRIIEVQIPVRPVRIATAIHGGTMQPKIVNREAFSAAGALYVGKNENNEIAAMWGEFVKQMSSLPALKPDVSYGVCRMIEDAEPGVFEYLAGVEVAPDAPLPAGMTLRSVPALKYAVFEHAGPLDGLGETYRRIYDEWLPAAHLQVDEVKIDMEVYTEDFVDGSPDSILEIWVAVK